VVKIWSTLHSSLGTTPRRARASILSCLLVCTTTTTQISATESLLQRCEEHERRIAELEFRLQQAQDELHQHAPPPSYVIVLGL
jgi:hypothetical protein